MSNTELFGQDRNFFSLSITMITSDCSSFTHNEQWCSVRYVSCIIKFSPVPINKGKAPFFLSKWTENKEANAVKVFSYTFLKLLSANIFVPLKKGHYAGRKLIADNAGDLYLNIFLR